MTEIKVYACGCTVEFDDKGQGKIIKLCEGCKTGQSLKPQEFPAKSKYSYSKPRRSREIQK